MAVHQQTCSGQRPGGEKQSQFRRLLRACYYSPGLPDFPYLSKKAPFIALELQRQGLVQKIKSIMPYYSESTPCSRNAWL
jgi:hypothetical protein